MWSNMEEPQKHPPCCFLEEADAEGHALYDLIHGKRTALRAARAWEDGAQDGQLWGWCFSCGWWAG